MEYQQGSFVVVVPLQGSGYTLPVIILVAYKTILDGLLYLVLRHSQPWERRGQGRPHHGPQFSGLWYGKSQFPEGVGGASNHTFAGVCQGAVQIKEHTGHPFVSFRDVVLSRIQ